MKIASLLYVSGIFLSLHLSKNGVESIKNIGLMFQNLTHLSSNRTCARGRNESCDYFLRLCFSFSNNLNCSLANFTTKWWTIQPGQNKTFGFDEYIDPLNCILSPVRVLLDVWKAQEVVLKADIWRNDTTPVFIEQLKIQGRLPYPINSFSRIGENQITECGKNFCLQVALYMWCDNITSCIGIFPTPTASIIPTTHKTIDAPKSMTVHAVKMISEGWLVTSTNEDKQWLVSSTNNFSSCTRSCGKESSGDKHGGSNGTLVKKWWFWFGVVAGVVFILLILVMTLLKRKKRRSKITQVQFLPKYNEAEVIEKGRSDDRLTDTASSMDMKTVN